MPCNSNDEWYHFDLGFLREILVNNLQKMAVGFRVIVLNATFNNISAISWRPVLLVEETGVLGENHRPTSSHWQIYHIMMYRVHFAWAGFKLTTLVVIGTDCISSYKWSYHTVTTTTAHIEMYNIDMCELKVYLLRNKQTYI